MARIAAIIVGVHGLIHLIGFAVPWRLMTSAEIADPGTALWGRVALSEPMPQVIGLVWLIVAVVLTVAAVGLWTGRGWARSVLAAGAISSVPIAVLGLPSTVMGLAVDVALLALVAAWPRTRAVPWI
jgi:hypothetical protein